MSKVKLTIIHAVDVEPEISYEPTVYAPSETMYFVPDKTNPFKYFKSIFQAEKEKNEWIRKYQNLLNGLNYWRSKAKLSAATAQMEKMADALDFCAGAIHMDDSIQTAKDALTQYEQFKKESV